MAKETVGKAVVKRITGSHPSALRAVGAAVVVGLGAAVLTYRALRSGS